MTGRPAARWKETANGAFLVGRPSNTSPGKDDEKAERQDLVISYLDRNSEKSIRIMPKNWNQQTRYLVREVSARLSLYFQSSYLSVEDIRNNNRSGTAMFYLYYVSILRPSIGRVSDVMISHDFLVWSHSNAVVHYALNESMPVLLYDPDTATWGPKITDWEQNPRRDGALLLLVTCYTSSLRPSSRCTLDTVTTHNFLMFSFVYNENSGHFLIFLPESGLCFRVWLIVAAVMVYFCELCMWSILLVDP